MVDSVDLNIIKLVSKRDNHEKYKDSITKALCTKESWGIVADFARYFEQHPEATEIVLEPFAIWQRVSNRPARKPEEHLIYERIVNNALTTSIDDEEIAKSLYKEKSNIAMAEKFEAYKAGDISFDELYAVLRDIYEAGGSTARAEHLQTGGLQAMSIETLAEYQRDHKGLYWRLEDLNRSIGPIRKGDFVVIAKRPEVGGTSFLCSEMSYMLDQLEPESNAIIFNNEESPDKVFSRMATTSLGVSYRDLLASPTVHQTDYVSYLAGKSWDLCHDTTMTVQSVQRQLEEKEYGLIGINVLLKVGGLSNYKEDHDKFQALGEHFRRVAQTYGPVLAVVQADPSAEGLRYIPQDRIYKSKTALQGEADALIMIGKDEDSEAKSRERSRFIYVAKNKLPPAPCTETINKHIKTEVDFDIETGRFTSINYKGNSKHGHSSS